MAGSVGRHIQERRIIGKGNVGRRAGLLDGGRGEVEVEGHVDCQTI